MNCKDEMEINGLFTRKNRKQNGQVVPIESQDVFDTIDSDGDSFLTKKEFRAVHKITEMLAPFFGKKITCGKTSC